MAKNLGLIGHRLITESTEPDCTFKEAVAILLKHRQSDTPLGAVSAAATSQEKVVITTLGEVSGCRIDTDTLLIIGNSETFVYNGRLITPRGYIEGVGY